MLSVRIWRRYSSDRPSEWSRAVRNQCSTLQSGISLLAVVNRRYVLMISRAAVYIKCMYQLNLVTQGHFMYMYLINGQWS